jgi:hypothetical protein
MRFSKEIADSSLSLALLFITLGVVYFEVRVAPTDSSENLSLAFWAAWGFAILGLSALSLLSRALYVISTRPGDLLYQLYPSILSILPFVFYWQVN